MRPVLSTLKGSGGIRIARMVSIKILKDLRKVGKGIIRVGVSIAKLFGTSVNRDQRQNHSSRIN